MNRLIALLTLLALGACSQEEVVHSKAASATARQGQGLAPPPPFGIASAGASASTAYEARIRQQRSFADLPDRGELLSYPGRDGSGGARVDGAYTWHRVNVSEEHALRAIATGRLRVITPSGQSLDIRYDHHFEHPSGDLSWVGHVEGQPGAQTILTFGAEAIYGSIAQPGKRSLRLTTRNGAGWIVETDPVELAGSTSEGANPRKPDVLAVPKMRAEFASAVPLAQSSAVPGAAAAAATTIDVLVGYTQGFASAQGGSSGATTRLNYLITVANEALALSQINARIRLVHAMQVNYTDNSANDETLEQLTGYDSEGDRYTTPNAAFNALRTARETYDADLVTLVRDFRDPEQNGCGIAWLIGGGRSGITPGDGQDYFGYSVVGDGYDENGNDTYYCRDETLIHELAHNMGSQHDREAAKGEDGVLDADDYGAFIYSFGYKTGTTAGNFYTIMAYGEQGQQDYAVFSNPRISTPCGGRACGTTNDDNARSLGQLAPIVATFRRGAPRPNLFAVNRQAGERTEVNIVTGASNYSLTGLRIATALGATGTRASWVFRAGDYNRDGTADMFVIKKTGTTRTEVHILDGATRFGTYLLHTGTALGPTGSEEGFAYDLGDYNRDGWLDLYAIKRVSSSGRTEVHVLDGRNSFKTFLLHAGTALHQTGNGTAWKFAVGDYNRDGSLDLYVIRRITSSGYAEVHVLDGARSFRSYLLHRTMPFRAPVSGNNWEFKVGDYNEDGRLDLYAIKKMGSGHTELHILTGADTYRSFLAHIPTALGITGSDWTWDFSLAK